jgi:hypothetical protein
MFKKEREDGVKFIWKNITFNDGMFALYIFLIFCGRIIINISMVLFNLIKNVGVRMAKKSEKMYGKI